MHHPKANADGLHISRAQGSRCLFQCEISLKTTTLGLEKYLETTNECMLKFVGNHERLKKLDSVMKEKKYVQVSLYIIPRLNTMMEVQQP